MDSINRNLVGLVFLVVTLVCARLAFAGGGGNYTEYEDPHYDAVARPTDPGGDTPFDPGMHRLVDLDEIVIGPWAPDAPETDLFTGKFVSSGAFFRLDLVVGGLINPPGSVDPFSFDPFLFGDHPVYGFIEIDMDRSRETGGEVDAPQYRYLGNAVRFGGRPADEVYRDRVALNESAFDGDFRTPPFVERHGEEFHLALLGGEVGWRDINVIAGDGDFVFEEGEIWRMRGSYFHRAHGFEPFSFVKGGTYGGEYAPISDLQFRHDDEEGETYISLVFPLTNVGAGLASGRPPEALNQDPTDQASVLEGLDDLHFSALFLSMNPTGLPEEGIITGWSDNAPSEFLDPAGWVVTALVGTSYTHPDPSGVYFVWTDIFPNIVKGDIDGDQERELEDAGLIEAFIVTEDGSDGVFDGRVVISAFARGFSLFDVSYDGIVDRGDVRIAEGAGDDDEDYDVDLKDIAVFQQCFSESFVSAPQCASMDFVGSTSVELDDLRFFVEQLTGPNDE